MEQEFAVTTASAVQQAVAALNGKALARQGHTT
jgi:hypothetical protein